MCLYFTAISQSETRDSTKQGVNMYIDEFVQEIRIFSMLAMELHLTYYKSSICSTAIACTNADLP